ncbi:MAG: RsmD family RNA methyltransferase, partial [Rhizobiaceae bacterium]
MRIVGGKLRGRRLNTPNSQDIRPTSDRTRESLFNMLANRQDLDEMRVVDLFAGTGALGLEALSRGAAFALFVENSTQGRGLI